MTGVPKLEPGCGMRMWSSIRDPWLGAGTKFEPHSSLKPPDTSINPSTVHKLMTGTFMR